MQKLNRSQVRSATRTFLICFAVMVLFTYLPVYFFFRSCKAQNENISKDLNSYKEILNKHRIIHEKVDSLYNQLTLLNTGKVANDLFLEKYIADNKAEISRIIDADSSVEFKSYALLMGNIDNMLKQKDTILGITNREQLALSDLMECMNKTRQVKKDLSYDPTRNFSTIK